MMLAPRIAIPLAAALLAGGLLGTRFASRAGPAANPSEAQAAGRVTGPDGRGEHGIFVTAQRAGSTTTHTVISDPAGAFDLGPLGPGSWSVRAHGIGIEATERAVEGETAVGELRVAHRPPTPAELPGASFLARLPEGEARRRFILDCTGCHVFNDVTTLPGGSPRTRAGWVDAVTRMLGFAGPSSGFPVISQGREPSTTADFLVAAFPGPGVPMLEPLPGPPPAASRAVITEFAIPEPGDLPHDLAVDATGRVIITGMFTHRLYVLDPASEAFEYVQIPVEGANPRAIEIDRSGNWWVALGNPKRLARYEVVNRTWESWPVGMYAHSIGVDTVGRAWFNGHFTRAPEQIGFVEPATGRVTTADVPAHPMAAGGFGPIPYELRVGPDGRVWMSELAGNRMVVFEPATEAFRTFTLPTSFSGPRRFDIGADGIVWIPEYANNSLARLDPGTGRFEEFPLPMPDAAPYVVRVDARTGGLWIGTGHADALLHFDPASRAFTTYPLPTRGALVRHLAIDARNGDVWAAYGASPGVPSKVARLRLRS